MVVEELRIKDIKWYLEREGMKCPYCEAEAVEHDPGKAFESDGREGEQRMYCRQCKRTWYDVYVLARIEEDL
jgi:transposase-like protein